MTARRSMLDRMTHLVSYDRERPGGAGETASRRAHGRETRQGNPALAHAVTAAIAVGSIHELSSGMFPP